MSNDAQDLLQTMGIKIDYGTILIGIGFSLVGWMAWRYGRKNQSGRHMLLGIGLMVYPYFVSSHWWSLVIGTLLTTALFWP